KIPAILRQDIGISGLIRVFIDDKIKGVEGLKHRAVDTAAGAENKRVGRVGGQANIPAWKEPTVIAREGRIFLNGVAQLVGMITCMLIPKAELNGHTAIFFLQIAVKGMYVFLVYKMVAFGIIFNPLRTCKILIKGAVVGAA